MHRNRKHSSNDREEDFLQEYQEILTGFMNSDEEKLDLPPINSFYRRLVHKLAKSFRMETASEGVDADRHIVVTKSKGSVIPTPIKPKTGPVWNFGDREFLVDPLQREVEVALEKDGTVSAYNPEKAAHYLAYKKVTTGSFKIKSNQIIQIQDNEW